MDDWQPIKTAPKDGTHILACSNSVFSTPYSKTWTFNQRPPTVVHYWGNPGEDGFYTSVNEQEPTAPYPATHWKPLGEPPSDVAGADASSCRQFKLDPPPIYDEHYARTQVEDTFGVPPTRRTLTDGDLWTLIHKDFPLACKPHDPLLTFGQIKVVVERALNANGVPQPDGGQQL